MRRAIFVLALVYSSTAANFVLAGDWPGAERRASRLAYSEDGITAAHDRVGAYSALIIPEDVDFEIHSPKRAAVEITTDGELRLNCRRCGAFAMGSEMAPADSKRLPFLSGGIIRSQVAGHFLSIQARIATNAAGEPYIVDRPLVVVAKYDDKSTTQPSTEIIDRSVGDIRSHGLLVDPTSQSPRTLVISIRSIRAVPQADGSDKLVPHYEYVFIHGRKNAAGNELTLHGFGTTHYRSRVHCFTPTAVPSQLHDCAIQGSIVFTSFAYGGQFPKANATRKVRLNETTACNITRLDEWVKGQGWTGDTWDNLPAIFDAMLDSKTPHDEPPGDTGIPIAITARPK